MLKSCAEFFLPIVTSIVNLSLRTGVVPDQCKKAKVIALFKGGDSENPGSYRPISIISAIAKVLETIVKTRIMIHISSNRILSKSQFGFSRIVKY